MTARDRILSRLAAGPAPSPQTPAEPLIENPVEQFAAYAADYRAQVIRTSEADLPNTLKALLAGETPIVPADLPLSWLGDRSCIQDQNQPAHELNAFPAVVTGCAVAIAETGTVILDAGPAQGRRALTLIPDHHICVVFTHQVVATIPQALALLNPAAPLTWISGPSATSDIELKRVEGVHGPRQLDIVLVGELPA